MVSYWTGDMHWELLHQQGGWSTSLQLKSEPISYQQDSRVFITDVSDAVSGSMLDVRSSLILDRPDSAQIFSMPCREEGPSKGLGLQVLH